MPGIKSDGAGPNLSTDSEIPDDFLRAVARAPARRPPVDLTPGSRWGSLGRYVLESRLGSGGMGTVYVARDSVLGRQVALKLLDVEAGPPESSQHQRLLREARVAATVEHERIARVYDVGDHNGVLFVAMELVRGPTLRQWMAARRASAAETLSLMKQIAEGLAALHTKDIIHRDLKPENVMITESGNIKLLDFGLARHRTVADRPASASAATSGEGTASRARACEGTRLLQQQTPSLTAVAGTPGYMAPEQCAGRAFDARVDVFALGVVAYEMVTGQRPFQGQSWNEISIATQQSAPVFDTEIWSSVPTALRAIIERALARDPGERFDDGAAVFAALEGLTLAESKPGAVSADLSAFARNATTRLAPVAPSRSRISRKVRTAVILIGIAVAAGAAGLKFLGDGKPLAPPPPGMAWIDVGTMTLGHTVQEVEQECKQLGKSCDRQLMMREVPAVEVTLPPFLLDINEVTNQQLADTLNSLESQLYVVEDEDTHQPRYVRFKRNTGESDVVLADLYPDMGGIEYIKDKGYRTRPGREQLPAIQVTWHGAQLFCVTRGKRLPTENEWEAAARGRQNRRYPWGQAAVRPGGVVLPRDGQIVADPAIATEVKVAAPVGTAFQDVTPEGIHDLGGNVSEWTDSVYVEGNRGALAPAGRDLPTVIRGGSRSDALMSRVSARTRRLRSSVGTNLGFRCAVSR